MKQLIWGFEQNNWYVKETYKVSSFCLFDFFFLFNIFGVFQVDPTPSGLAAFLKGHSGIF